MTNPNMLNTAVPLHLTETAVSKLEALLSPPEKQNNCLRIYIVGGGCSGFQYGFTLDENYHPNEDIIIKTEKNGKTMIVAIDPLSFQYLEGAKIDYSESLLGARFTVENPHAQTTCGCGSSFSLKEE